MNKQPSGSSPPASSRPTPKETAHGCHVSAKRQQHPAAADHHGADLREGVGAVGRAAARPPRPAVVNANTAIPVPMDVPVADWVGEGGVKPVSEVGVGVKVDDRQEGRRPRPRVGGGRPDQPGRLYDQLSSRTSRPPSPARSTTPRSTARACGPGRRPVPGVPRADPEQRRARAPPRGAGGLYADLVNGVGKVIDNNYDFTGFAADKRLLVDAALSTDTVGRPLFVGQDT
jgi:hypothetical protein